MKSPTRSNGGWLRNTTVTGLVPLLLLASVPGCTARHMPDWSRVQEVEPDTKTELRLFEDLPFSDLPDGRRKIEGRFHSAASESVTLRLEDGQLRTFQRPAVRKVLTRRPAANRWPGWLALLAPFAIYGVVAAVDRTGGEDSLVGAPAALSLSSIPFFYFADMEGIYEVQKHPQRRNSPRPTGPATIKAAEPNDSK